MAVSHEADSTEENLFEAFWQMEDSKHTHPPGPLFHYTSAPAMIAIVQDRGMQATHVRFMADAAEIYYGRDLLRDVIKSELAGWEAGEAAILEDALLMFAQATDHNLPPIFAVCFSERSDDAAQWDRYAGGQGYALGFDSTKLGVLFRKRKGQGTMDSATLVPVLYQEEEQKRLFRQIVKRAARLAEKSRSQGNKKEFQARCSFIGHAAGWALMRLMARCKGIAYESEREWRMIFTKGPAVMQPLSKVAEVKATASGLTPFVTLDYFEDLHAHKIEPDLLPIVQVVHGPKTRKEAPDATRVLFNHAGYLHVVDGLLQDYPASIKKSWKATPVQLTRSSVRLV